MPFTYRNPIYPHDFADPFVLKASEGYFAYGTAAPGPDGRVFPILRSDDLLRWQRLPGALEPLKDLAAFAYWAPEVIEQAGRYYLFYSASTVPSDEGHRLRVAVADTPAGPFVDSGKLLLPEAGFSIDAGPFRDPRDGKVYLFFATDFVNEEPHGTGIAVVPLAEDLLSVEGSPQTVIRAQADWQTYENNRNYKGRVWRKWNCLEGPNVLFHEGRYYCLYSGGAWHGDNYGVGFAVADHPLGPWRDEFASQGPTVLRGIPGKVIGPGHNCHVLAPDGKTLLIVYHAWDAGKTARRMCIDPLLWTANGPRTDGPSTEARSAILPANS